MKGGGGEKEGLGPLPLLQLGHSILLLEFHIKMTKKKLIDLQNLYNVCTKNYKAIRNGLCSEKSKENMHREINNFTNYLILNAK